MTNDDNGLFGTADEMAAWAKEWQDMPEFVQKDLMPWKRLIVNFENINDLNAFAKVIGQKITIDTRFIWYPEAELLPVANKRYNNELDCDEKDIDES